MNPKASLHISIFAFVILFCASSAAQWKHVESNLPQWNDARSIDACDSSTAVIVIRPTSNYKWSLYVTVNGGGTWKALPLPVQNSITDVAITDSSRIWVTTDDGRIYGTVDGGSHWTLQFYDTTACAFMNFIRMFDRDHGIAMGDPGPALNRSEAVLRTANAGTSWSVANDPSLLGQWSGDMWRRIDFPNSTVGYFFVSPSQRLYRTADGGVSWSNTNYSAGASHVIKFYNETIGICAGGSNIYRTKDGGAAWQSTTLTGYQTGWGWDVEFFHGDPSKVLYASGNNLFFSGDTGRTWKIQPLEGSNGSILDIVMVPDGGGWMVGNKTVYHASQANLMSTGVHNGRSTDPAVFRLGQNFPNPFNPATIIPFSLASPAFVTLKVYDLLGREISTLVSEPLPGGTYSREWESSEMPTGVYFYRLQAGAHTATRRMVIVK